MSKYPFLGLGFNSWTQKFGRESSITFKIVVGAWGDDDNGSVSGSVYVYDLDGTNEAKITAPGS